MILQAGKHRIDLEFPAVMGVLNITPDSFSDGGRFADRDRAIRHAEAMFASGAAIIDIGGESTRPGAGEVPVEDEIDRVVPVIEFLSARLDVCLSVDTSKPPVMRAALAAGAALVNDIYALRREGALSAVADSDCAVCLMHMQGAPHSMQVNPSYRDVAAEVASFLQERVESCVDSGIATDRIVVDPGFGFGKTDRHNFELLAGLRQLRQLGVPLLVGLSRKRSLGKLTGRDIDGRMPAGLAAAVLAVERGANIVRTHDVAETVDALKIVAAVARSG